MANKDISDPDIRPVPVEELTIPVTQAGLAFWRDACDGGVMPPVSAISPAALKELLPSVVIFEPVRTATAGSDAEPEDFRYRLLGECVNEVFDVSLAGRCVSELTEYGDSYIRRNLSFYRLICARKEPLALTGRMEMIDKDYVKFEAVYLPFSESGSRVDRILAVVGRY